MPPSASASPRASSASRSPSCVQRPATCCWRNAPRVRFPPDFGSFRAARSTRASPRRRRLCANSPKRSGSVVSSRGPGSSTNTNFQPSACGCTCSPSVCGAERRTAARVSASPGSIRRCRPSAPCSRAIGVCSRRSRCRPSSPLRPAATLAGHRPSARHCRRFFAREHARSSFANGTCRPISASRSHAACTKSRSCTGCARSWAARRSKRVGPGSQASIPTDVNFGGLSNGRPRSCGVSIAATPPTSNERHRLGRLRRTHAPDRDPRLCLRRHRNRCARAGTAGRRNRRRRHRRGPLARIARIDETVLHLGGEHAR